MTEQKTARHVVKKRTCFKRKGGGAGSADRVKTSLTTGNRCLHCVRMMPIEMEQMRIKLSKRPPGPSLSFLHSSSMRTTRTVTALLSLIIFQHIHLFPRLMSVNPTHSSVQTINK